GGAGVPFEEVALPRDVREPPVVGQRRGRKQPTARHLWEARNVAAGQAVVGVQQAETGSGQQLVVGGGGIDLRDVRGGQQLVVVGDRRPGWNWRSGSPVVCRNQVVVRKVLADQEQVRRLSERELVLDDVRCARTEQVAHRRRLEQVQRTRPVGCIRGG